MTQNLSRGIPPTPDVLQKHTSQWRQQVQDTVQSLLSRLSLFLASRWKPPHEFKAAAVSSLGGSLLLVQLRFQKQRGESKHTTGDGSNSDNREANVQCPIQVSWVWFPLSIPGDSPCNAPDSIAGGS